MEIIEYFSAENKAYWLEKIKESDWSAGQYLYQLLRKNELKNLVGENTKVLMLVDGKNLVSFCTFAEKDDIQPTELTPWIGWVYTFPGYRGKHYAGMLLKHAERLALEAEMENIYISTGHVGLYEKYGYQFFKIMQDVNGEDSRVYVKHCNRRPSSDLQKKKLFLFDIDGTLAVGDTLYEGSAELLDYITRIGGKSYFITNNSTRSGADYVEKFRTSFGLETGEEQFITSGYMTIRFLTEHYAHKKIFVLGTTSFVAELLKNGLYVTETADTELTSGATAEGSIACVVVAYDSELTYNKLVEVCKVLSTTDVPFYATNPDLCCPIDFGFIPDCGAICNMITESTGKHPIYLGKPSREVVELCLALSGFSREETLVVGDRLYTDIACGINGGVDTCVVFTGEAKPEDMVDTEFPATYCLDNIKELLAHCTEA